MRKILIVLICTVLGFETIAQVPQNPGTPAKTMIGSNGTIVGASGLVPQPAATDNIKFLKGSATYSSMVEIANGNIGIGTTTPNAQLQFSSVFSNRKIVIFEGFNNDHQFIGFGVNANLLRYQVNATNSRHGFFAATSATASSELMSILGTGNVGIGITTPTSKLHVNGSLAGAIINVTATTTLNANNQKVLVSNGATNIIITLPDALTCIGREYVISRAAGSTGSITISVTGANQVQSLTGTTGTTTTIGLHSATGGGLNQYFTAINVGGVGIWVRL